MRRGRPPPRKRTFLQNLMERQISRGQHELLKRQNAGERFRNYTLHAEYDTHDFEPFNLKLAYIRKRSKIVEIVSAKSVVFALTQSGVCAAFSRDTMKRLCFLNVSPDEVIRSLFFNKSNCSLITVSVFKEDGYSTLRCRTTPLEYIRRSIPDAGFPLFESESLRWPGFVEFDDVNGKVLTFSAVDKSYKVWDLTNYTLLYTILDKGIQEIKISPGVMLLIYKRTASHIPLKLLSIEDGTVLRSFTHMLHRNKHVDFIEQFNDKLLIKQDSENLQILDVRTLRLQEVSQTDFVTPSAFIFLYENQMFLTFKNRTVSVWNSRGELVTTFDDHELWYSDCNTNNIYITSAQDLIISYCKPKDGRRRGSINVSHIRTGECLHKISAPEGKQRLKQIENALDDVTAIFYNEERNEIITGNRQGSIHVWTN